MKKITFVLAILFSLTFCNVFSQVCSDLLAKDENFKAAITGLKKYSGEMTIKFSSQQRKEILQKLDEIKKLSAEDQYNAVADLLKMTKEELLEMEKSIATPVFSINKKYGKDIPKETISNAIIQTEQENINVDPDLNARCGWRFGLCAAAVGAEGLVMVAGCEAATIGIGTPVCVAATIIITADKLEDCRERHC